MEAQTIAAEAFPLEVSVVMPCLNEAQTLATCIRKARAALERLGVAGEVVVADNGSTDGSPELARREGARVVAVAEKGYGSALRGGIEAARGRYVIMGDADDSYDFSALDAFVAALRGGADLVMGNRFSGGIRPGAMPPLNRYLGNPVLTGMGRLFFGSAVGDFHCGLRAFSRTAYDRMALQTAGMEFASEMVISATLKGMRIAEVPITLHRDGRSRPPHLRPWRDGWRHLRFMLLYSPRWLFLYPGLFLMALGTAASLWLIAGPRPLGPVTLDIHTLIVAGFLVILGYQLVVFAALTRVFAALEGLLPVTGQMKGVFRLLNLERGIAVGLLGIAAGAGLGLAAVWQWKGQAWGALDPRVTMRALVPAIVLLVLGVQTLFSSFFFSLLGLSRARRTWIDGER